MLFFALVAAAPAISDPQQPGFRLVASYDRPGVPVPKWSFEIAPSGRVSYTSEHAAGVHALLEGPIVFTLSRDTASRLQQLLIDSHGLQPCETKTKNLARMGMKTLEYQAGTEPAAQCSFNYTDNKPLGAAAELLIAVSYTLEQGATLEWLHRYDRLGLDVAMTQLATAAHEGHARELQAIRPTLQSLVDDEAVLDRVRQKAAALLSVAAKD